MKKHTASNPSRPAPVTTRVIRPDEDRGLTPKVPPVNWAQVQRPTGSAVKPPKK